ncbi:hypothetical protein O181_057354 [Austropuccinia psidii MF-1]|uniref:Uncharacterized protein n=1 Tax=Austropuccinia psidii MF-1 TaxID=1389203 RepID=A0A9Q3EAE6_9BASI|nr:hypothetical protein [Austropuccinia psidii MF-1]
MWRIPRIYHKKPMNRICSKEEYMNSLEDIVTGTKIGTTRKKLDIKSPNKPLIIKDKQKEPFKPSNPDEKKKLHECGSIGHLANNCLKKAKIIEILKTGNHNDREE